MAQYAKTEVVEARQYEGPRLTVVSDKYGEQVAVSGDWLIGTERGKVHVISADAFKEFSEYTPTSADETLAALEAELAAAKAQVDSMSASNASLGHEVEELTAAKSELSGQLTDQKALQAHVDALTASLTAEQAKSAGLQTKLDALIAAETAKSDAQAKIEAAQNVVDSTLGK